MAQPFRFAARLPEITNPKEWRDQIKRIEDLGYSSVAVPDHFTQGSVHEPLIALSAAAMVSDRLRLLSLVLGNDYRHPVMLHKAAANLDVLSAGRLELGIGAGWMITDYEAAGMNYDPPGTRISRFEESVRIVKGLFGDAPFDFAGEHYKITALDGTPKSAQKPHPPILIGGGGKRVLGIAAREADIIGVNANLSAGAIGQAAAQSMSAEQTDLKLGWVRDAVAKAGRSIDDIELQTSVFMATISDSAGNVDTMRNNLAAGFGLEVAQVGESPAVLIGSVEQCIEKLEERRERWGFSYVGLPDPVAAAPIVARLAGK